MLLKKPQDHWTCWKHLLFQVSFGQYFVHFTHLLEVKVDLRSDLWVTWWTVFHSCFLNFSSLTKVHEKVRCDKFCLCWLFHCHTFHFVSILFKWTSWHESSNLDSTGLLSLLEMDIIVWFCQSKSRKKINQFCLTA